MFSLCYYVIGAKEWGEAITGKKRCPEKGDTDVADDQQAIAVVPSY